MTVMSDEIACLNFNAVNDFLIFTLMLSQRPFNWDVGAVNLTITLRKPKQINVLCSLYNPIDINNRLIYYLQSQKIWNIYMECLSDQGKQEMHSAM